MNFKWSLLLAFCLGFFSLLLGRILDVQLVKGAAFRVQADNNRFFSLPLSAERGGLLDRYGQPLVWNTRRYYKITNPERIYYSTEPITRPEALAAMASDSASVMASTQRLYRFPESLAHVLGFVGSVTTENLAQDNTLGLSDQVGKLGLELTLNRSLRGQDGKAEYEVDALGQRQKKRSEQLAQDGETVKTTLDPYLSEVAYRALQGQKGAVVVMDAQTGQVLSLVSSPSYDANLLTKSAATPEAEQDRRTQVQSLFNDTDQVFFNRAINGLYPPGSVFKIVTALAGLEYGKIDETTTVLDEGVLKVGEYQYGNWYFRQYGRTEGEVNLTRSLSRSNDIYFYKVAEWVGPDNLANMAKLLGLGSKTTVELSPQAEGLVPTPAWKEARLAERWFLGNTYHFGIGQGDLLVSPLQVAGMFQSLANDGTLCQPTLLGNKGRRCSGLSFKTENIELVMKGLLDACSAGGTAYPFFTYNATRRQPDASVTQDIVNGAVACKTGTAEFGGADERGYRKTHGWFAAMVHLDKDLFTAADSSASSSAAVETKLQGAVGPESELQVLRQEWLAALPSNPLPEHLVFVSLVESDETQPFKEGSRDASPVIKKVIDWMLGESTSVTADTTATSNDSSVEGE